MVKVFVGMSGGVDSSVTAALLVEQGYDVTGVYMKNWSQNLAGMHCPWAEDVADAKRVAVGLGIDFQIFDFEAEYKQKVVEAMVAEYQAGRVPNPDVMCNQEIKFKVFLEASLDKGADLIATGHYAKTGDGQNNLELNSLYQAKDTDKDQTYFLYRVKSQALEKTLFPLGDYTKTEVRQLAIDKNLWTADKKESMGICFVGQVGIKEFLEQYIDLQAGAIINQSTGEILGEHQGAILYTLGQRHGLNVGGGLPFYVVDKDIKQNIVYVSQDINHRKIWADQIELTDINWINDPPAGQDLQIRLRHRGPLIDVTTLNLTDNRVQLTLKNKQKAINVGQSAVIYQQNRVVGGGIIQKTD